jgi:hypothetical protein
MSLRLITSPPVNNVLPLRPIQPADVANTEPRLVLVHSTVDPVGGATEQAPAARRRCTACPAEA